MTRTEVTPRTRARHRAARARRRRERLLGGGAQVVAFLVGLGVLAGALSGGQWPWVLATYLRWPQTLAAVVAAVVLLRLRWWRSGVAAAAVAVGLVVSVVAPLRALETVDAPRDRTLRIAVHNTGYGAGDVDAVAQAIREADVDLAVLLESEDVADALADALDDLSLLPARGGRGPDTAPPTILARRQWRTDLVPLGEPRPATIVRARIGRRPLDVVTIHPLPPVTAGWSASHHRSIARLVGDVLPRRDRFVVACDCNTTPWSPSMRWLLDAGLRGPTVAPTFGAPLLGIPLDHVLLSDGVAAVAREQWPFGGSDHRMIVTEVTLR